MKKSIIIVFILLCLVVSMTSIVFAAINSQLIYVDVDMGQSYNVKKPNSQNGPLTCKYTVGNFITNKVTGRTILGIAPDQTGSATIYIKGQNGSIEQRTTSTINGGFIDTNNLNVSGCTVAEYVQHLGVRTTYENGIATYSQDWFYRFY